MSKTIPDSIKSYKIEKKETYKLSNITLYTAINTYINEKVLIHIYPKEGLLTNPNEVTFMNNQIYLMKILNHKNILQLFEIIETRTHTFLIFEYFQGMKLSDYIIKKKKLSEDESLKIYKELLSALLYLKEMYICNLNLNSQNILIDSKNNIKICDFKFGHFYSPVDKSKAKLIGDHFSACPELHSKRPYNPELADMWSSGILLYQMITGTLPFKSQKDLELIRLIIRGDYLMPNSISNNMRNLIKGLLETKEEKRLKLNDVFNQQIIKEKKIIKNSLIPGLNILTTKYPIDDIVLNIFKNKLNIDEEILKQNLENNKFNEITSLFKQIVSKLKMKEIPIINDLSSNKFINYIKDNNNLLKEEEQINNIQNYLKKEEEVKKRSEDIAAILLNNLNEISKDLQDLKRQYDRAKRGIRPLKRMRSFGDTKTKKKKMFDFDEEKKNKENDDNTNNTKRNTAVFQNKILNKENKQEKKPEIKNDIEEIPKSDDNIQKEEEKNIKDENNGQNQLNEIKEKEKINENEDKNIEILSKKINEEKIDKKIEQKFQEKIISSKSPAKKEEKKLIIPEKKFNLKEQLNSVKLSKVPMKNQIEQKAKKIMMNKPEMNNIKPKMNLKKEDLEKELNLLKAKKEIKNTNTKNINNNKDIKQNTQKKVEQKASGFKNLKEIFGQNMKRQRVMSNDNAKK